MTTIYYSRRTSPCGKEYEIEIFDSTAVYGHVLTVNTIKNGWFGIKRKRIFERHFGSERDAVIEAEQFLTGPVFNENTTTSNR